MSELRLKMENRGGRTVVSDCFFTAPLKVAKPFYHERHTELMLMQASAGLLDGDGYEIALEVSDGANAEVTGQSYTKVFNAGAGVGARQRVRLAVGENASLRWFPPPIIPFAGSRFRSRTEVYLTEKSKLFLCEILACGRAGMGERFAFAELRSRTEVHVGDRLAFLDNTRLIPEEAKLSGKGFFDNRTHAGMLYLYGCDNFALPESESAEAELSASADGLCVRILADSAEEIIAFAREASARGFG